jgi:aspartyl-tRNA(Asn)/glutamyl-tRNA(Gln) amidotransferase subunit C
MSDAIDEAQVRRIARLARLNLNPDEVQLFSGQLARILAYIRQLQQVDTTGVEPLAHPLPIMNVLRDDEPHEPYTTEQALANSPQRAGDFFKVPAVLEES